MKHKREKNHGRLQARTHWAAFWLGLWGFTFSLPSRADSGVPLHGFADVGGGWSSSNTPAHEVLRNFYMGTLDFYLTPDFGDRVKSLIEIAFEPDLVTGSVGVDLERLQAGYVFSNLATLWLGRFHTPYGFWNTAFHHGAQIQPSIYRPRFLDFEDKGGILPAHSVGFWLTGSDHLGDSSLKVSYSAYVANGSRILPDDQGGPGTLDPNLVRDDNPPVLVGGNLALHLNEELRLGVHGFQMRSDFSGASPSSTFVRMYGAYLVHESETWNILAELYRFTNKARLSEEKWKSVAGYAQVGYAWQDDLSSFYRYERVGLNQLDAYFANQANANSYYRHAIGLKYDVNPKAAVKFEYLVSRMGNHMQGTPDQNDRRFAFQYALRF